MYAPALPLPSSTGADTDRRNRTDCAKYLNGRGIGARYDGTYSKDGESSYYIGSCEGKTEGSVEGLSPADKADIKTFIGAQMAAYEKASGWIFWVSFASVGLTLVSERVLTIVADVEDGVRARVELPGPPCRGPGAGGRR